MRRFIYTELQNTYEVHRADENRLEMPAILGVKIYSSPVDRMKVPDKLEIVDALRFLATEIEAAL